MEIEDSVATAWQRTFDVPAHRGDRLLDVLANREGHARSVQLGTLFGAIEDATRISLPLSVVYGSPTAADLSGMLRARAWPPHERPIRICPGDAAQSLFCFPGLGGIGIDILGLARHLKFPGSVCFNPPRGIDGSEPHRTLPEMVEDHVAIIQRVQPSGPYWLLGYSWGGLVALEVARRLRAAGETVAFLGMLDPVLSQADWTYAAWVNFIGRRIVHHLGKLRQAGSAGAALRECRRLLVPAVDKVLRLFGINRLWPLAAGAEVLPPALAAIWVAESGVIPSYRVGYYDGEVTVFATRRGYEADVDPRRIWPSKVGRFTLHWVPGDHSLTRPEVEDTARVISAALAQAWQECR